MSVGNSLGASHNSNCLVMAEQVTFATFFSLMAQCFLFKEEGLWLYPGPKRTQTYNSDFVAIEEM
jgi:hypothetical protein